MTGSAPLAADGALDLKVDGRLEAGLANALLSAGGRNASGAVTVAMQLRGTLAKPDARGTLTLANGAFSDDQTGFKLTGVSALVTANGDTIRIDRLGGGTPNGGTIGASGEVKLDPVGGFPGNLRIVGQRAQLVSNDVVAATADLSLDLSGRLAQKPSITGLITINSMDITVPGRLGGVAAPIPGTKHLNPTATARARLAQIARARAERARAAVRRDAGADGLRKKSRVRARARAQRRVRRRSACGGQRARSCGDRWVRSPSRHAGAGRPAADLHPREGDVSRRGDPGARPRRRDERGGHHCADQRHRPRQSAGFRDHLLAKPAGGRDSSRGSCSRSRRAAFRRSRRSSSPTRSGPSRAAPTFSTRCARAWGSATWASGQARRGTAFSDSAARSTTGSASTSGPASCRRTTASASIST